MQVTPDSSTPEDTLGVFVCYSHADQPWVSVFNHHLKDVLHPYDYDTWFDGEQIPTDSTMWRPFVNEAFKNVQAAVIVIGALGPGLSQKKEITFITDVLRQHRPSMPVVVVLVNGGEATSEFDGLRDCPKIDFHEGDQPYTVPYERLLAQVISAIRDDGGEHLRRIEEEIEANAERFLEARRNARGCPELNEGQQRTRDALTQVKSALRGTRRQVEGRAPLTVFVGEDLGWNTPESPRRTARLVSKLFEEIGIDYEPKIPFPLNAAGLHYLARHPRRSLFDILEECVADQAATEALRTPFWQELGVFLARTSDELTLDRGRRGRPGSPMSLLVVSTAFDDYLEAALLLAGVSFIRAVDVWPEAPFRGQEVETHIRRFSRDHAAGTQSRRREGIRTPADARREYGLSLAKLEADLQKPNYKLYDWINESEVGTNRGHGRNSWSELLSPEDTEKSIFPIIIYKPFGSQDLPDNFAISTDDHLDMVTSHGSADRREFIDQILPDSSRTTSVFFGFDPLDPAFLALLYYLKARLPKVKPKRLLFPAKPDVSEGNQPQPESLDSLEDRITVRVVKEPPHLFLARLNEADPNR